MEKIKYEMLKVSDINDMGEVFEDDDMKLNEKKLNQFITSPNNYGFIAKLDNKIVGFAYGYSLMRPDNIKDMFFLYSIGILPKYQEQKLGTGLMEFVEKFAKKNFSEMFVITDKANVRACKLYSHFGMKNDYENEIVYVKDYMKSK